MASKLKGVRNLHTLSGRVDASPKAYRAYMQITCLEMEKARRGCERRSAAQRIAEIDARLAEIETEKAKIVQTLAGQEAPAGAVAAAVPQPPPRRGFRIRY